MARNFRVDNEFKNMIPPLSDKEYQMLKESILKEGCRDKLIVWDKGITFPILVDGHNRLKICEEHQIPYEIKKMEFESYMDAFNWMRKNQLARRNLTDMQRSELIGKIYSAEKIMDSHKGNQYTESGSGHNDHKQKTSEVIAQQYGISEKTVRRNEHLSNAIDELKQNIEPETVNRILTEDLPMTKKEVIELSKEEPEQQRKVIDLIATGQAKKVDEAKKQLDPINIEYDKQVKEIDAKYKRVKKVMNLLNYTQFLGITEQSVQEYLEDFPREHESFIKDLDKLKNIIDETIGLYNGLNKIRRIK